ACGGSTLTPRRELSLGNGVVATLATDGSFTITKGGAVLLRTAGGKPLFSRALDVDDPDGFHDPKSLEDLSFERVDDAVVSMDSPSSGVLHLTTTDDGAATVLVSLALAADDGFYGGLGERFEHADARGSVVGMQLEIDGTYESATTDRHVPVPWFVSSNGYAVFVKSRESGAFDVAATDPAVVRGTFEGKAMDVTIVVDADPLAAAAKLVQMTGLPRKTPVTALAPMMWRHVDDQAQLLADLAKIRSLKIPTTTFWIDDGWQTGFNTMDFDRAKYPDVRAVAATAKSLGFEMWGWSSPYLEKAKKPPANDAQALYAQADAAGYFVKGAGGQTFTAPGPDSDVGFGLVDFTDPDARAFWAGRVGGAVSTLFHGFKLDYAEDAVPDLLNARLGLHYHDGSTDRTARAYPLGYHGAYRDALLSTPSGGVLIVRASTYGGAAVADIVWPGDLDNAFQHRGDQGPKALLVGGLPASVVAGQSLAASGFPLYGADIAGYRGDAPTKESLLRWSEASALSMVMQLGPGEKKYPWNYDSEAIAVYTQLAALHQKLVPYLATVLADAQANGTPTIRSLPLAFPHDAKAMAAADDEWLLGPSLLAAPVVTAGATNRSVYLPAGTWFSWWDGSRIDGPTTLTVDAPFGEPPLFVRAGAALPLLPDGIDTLLPATDAATIGIDKVLGNDEAMLWPSGDTRTTTLDGSAITVTDDANGLEIGWQPQGAGNAITITADLSARVGKMGALTKVEAKAGGITVGDSEPAVRTATTSTYYLAGNKLILRFVGAGDVTIQ
ncbi:MAG: TIM-barrel domain-containing protein, partial [Polyangiaceae bacterium]